MSRPKPAYSADISDRLLSLRRAQQEGPDFAGDSSELKWFETSMADLRSCSGATPTQLSRLRKRH